MEIEALKLLIKNTLFTIIIPGTVTVVVPYLLIPQGPWPFVFELDDLRYLGLIFLLIGISIYLSTIFDFAQIGRGTPAPMDPPKALVERGLYKYVRNPMYVGVLSVLLGEMVYFESALMVIYIGFSFIALNVFIIFYEEPTLERLFGESYLEYKNDVPRWLPRLKRAG
jgi:protein-S-isoprenylcysteine O-methyltransferase Ste14